MPALHAARNTVVAATALIAAAAAVAPTQATELSGSETARALAVTESPIKLWAPRRVTVDRYGGRVDLGDLGLRVVASGGPFEIRSTRGSYSERVRQVWKSPGGDVLLPVTSASVGRLSGFLTFEIHERGTSTTLALTSPACPRQGERLDPAAVFEPRYMGICENYSAYALGAVHGVQEGWGAPLGRLRQPALSTGTYDVKVSINPAYADAIGISEPDRVRSMVLTVRKPGPESDPGGVGQRVVARPTAGFARKATTSPDAHHSAQEPSTAGTAPVGGPMPDLRSLPASEIRLNPKRTLIRFAATVWNAGDSPLVVDGFRRDDEAEMDAYQYFLDGSGRQTGYQRVGEMHWDPKPTHQHWHFKDFARYSLLDSNKTEVVRSRKEAFCLANTDAVDLTVPAASWKDYDEDLSTACGERSSLGLREVLASGWGDTYEQFRAGQAFKLEGLPNGIYYIATVANPLHRLVEASTGNNVSYRRIRLGGTPGHRTLRVPKVGLVTEPRSLY